MTHLSIPVAAATQGAINDMSDVIDSLKRLERIGAENSKTIEKVISAARDLEIVIGKQYESSRANYINGLEILRRLIDLPRLGSAEAVAQKLGIDYKYAAQIHYQVAWGKPDGPYLLEAPGFQQRVSANREAALRFAGAIANGLMTLLEQDLLQRHNVDSQALALLGGAKAKIVSPAE